MHTITKQIRRLGNQIFRNIAVSIIAKKMDLYVEYCSKDLIESLGIKLYSGSKIFSETKKITDENYM